MKKLLVIALLGIGMLGYAQPKDGKKEKLTPEQKAEKVSSNMKKSLELSDEQTSQIKAIVLKRAQTNQEIKANADGTKKEIRKEIKEENEISKEELKKILTPEQLAKHEAKMDKRKEKIKEKRENKKNGKKEEKVNSEK